MKQARNVIAAGMSLSLALGALPPTAFAAGEADASARAAASVASAQHDASAAPAVADGLPESDYDKADFYSAPDEDDAAPRALLAARATVEPRVISKDMLYFGAYEGGSYDRTFSYGDGYHAMGYYQFDHRYGLKDFLLACYDYDPATYAMFARFAAVSDAEFEADDAIRKNGAFTPLGRSLIDAWEAAYAADAYEFSRLQDDWAYTHYYLPAERYLAGRGIHIADRNDAVKGLCWGLTNLFGATGWHKFVGGVSDGYDWNGVYHYLSENYDWPGCGLRDDMSDVEFVTVLCNYVVDNVAVFYAGQPEYHEGWQNRYRKELAQCLAIIERTGDTHAPSSGDDGLQDGGEGAPENGGAQPESPQQPDHTPVEPQPAPEPDPQPSPDPDQGSTTPPAPSPSPAPQPAPKPDAPEANGPQDAPAMPQGDSTLPALPLVPPLAPPAAPQLPDANAPHEDAAPTPDGDAGHGADGQVPGGESEGDDAPSGDDAAQEQDDATSGQNDAGDTQTPPASDDAHGDDGTHAGSDESDTQTGVTHQEGAASAPAAPEAVQQGAFAQTAAADADQQARAAQSGILSQTNDGTRAALVGAVVAILVAVVGTVVALRLRHRR